MHVQLASNRPGLYLVTGSRTLCVFKVYVLDLMDTLRKGKPIKPRTSLLAMQSDKQATGESRNNIPLYHSCYSRDEAADFPRLLELIYRLRLYRPSVFQVLYLRPCQALSTMTFTQHAC